MVELPRLQKLQLVYCDIDDESYDDFASIRKIDADPHQQTLADIWLYGTGFSGEAAERLANDTGVNVDRRNGAFLGVYFAQGNEPCVITRVVSNSAAAHAGIEVGDTILKFADRDISMADEFRGAVSNYEPGDEVIAVVLRDNMELELKIELGRFQDIEQ